MRIVGLMKTTLLDYPGKVASTIFTGGCNFRCPYCHNGDLVLDFANMEPYTEDEVFKHLNKRKNTLNGVCITGGEPTLQMDLPDFISKVKDLGLLVKLDTNGTNPTMLTKLLDDKLLDYNCAKRHIFTKNPINIGSHYIVRSYWRIGWNSKKLLYRLWVSHNSNPTTT